MSYVAVVGRKVLRRFRSLKQASEFADRNPQCEILPFYSFGARDTARVLGRIQSQEFCWALDFAAAVSSARSEVQNPRCLPLTIESGRIGTMIEEAADGFLEVSGAAGQVDVDGDLQPTSNSDCAKMRVRFVDLPAANFDTQKRLPAAVAKWLRDCAQSLYDDLMAAAAKVEEVPDDRDLTLIRRFVAEDQNVKYSDTHGLVDVTKRLPDPRWEPYTPAYRKILGETINS